MIKSMLVALSTYSALPMPQLVWDERNMRYSICFLPVVGMLVGGALILWNWLSAQLGISEVLFAVGATALPLLISGGIHMDGFMDTVDALSSHTDRDRMLEILKDPHTGAFAVIFCSVYLLLGFGFYSELQHTMQLLIISIGFVLSRALTSLSTVCFPRARASGLLAAYTEHAPQRAVKVSMAIVSLSCAAAMVVIAPLEGGICCALCLAVFLWYRHAMLKRLGGVTGDTSGFLVQLLELACLLGTVAAALIGRMGI